MAAPLFVADEATLKSKLRLSAVPATAVDTEAIIDEGILHARVEFYRELGTAKVTALLAIAFTETPTTEDGVLRALANITEVMMVRCYLMIHLPNTFMDASGDVNARWNEEAPTRERSSMELSEQIKACKNAIMENLLVLAGGDIDECAEIQTFDGSPDCPAPNVGMSLKGGTFRHIAED